MLHYLDESKRPRECDNCMGRGAHPDGGFEGFSVRCRDCHGTGRLGDPDARPDVETWRALVVTSQFPGRWFATIADPRSGSFYSAGAKQVSLIPGVGFATEAAALDAARKAAMALPERGYPDEHEW